MANNLMPFLRAQNGDLVNLSRVCLIEKIGGASSPYCDVQAVDQRGETITLATFRAIDGGEERALAFMVLLAETLPINLIDVDTLINGMQSPTAPPASPPVLYGLAEALSDILAFAGHDLDCNTQYRDREAQGCSCGAAGVMERARSLVQSISSGANPVSRTDRMAAKLLGLPHEVDKGLGNGGES